MNDDLKDMISWAVSNGNCTAKEFELLCALAEIGRLAVEVRSLRSQGSIRDATYDERMDAIHAAEVAEANAADAFLASRKGYQAYTPTNPSF